MFEIFSGEINPAAAETKKKNSIVNTNDAYGANFFREGLPFVSQLGKIIGKCFLGMPKMEKKNSI